MVDIDGKCVKTSHFQDNVLYVYLAVYMKMVWMHDLKKKKSGASSIMEKQKTALNHVQCVSIVPSQSQVLQTCEHVTTNSLYIPMKQTFFSIVSYSHSSFISCIYTEMNHWITWYLFYMVSVPDDKWQFCSGDVCYLFGGWPVIDWLGKQWYTGSTSLLQTL